MSEERKEGYNPIYFLKEGEDWRTNPIYRFDEKNTPERFVIVKTTADGKYCVGKMIHYTFNGVDIITDSDNAIFVDVLNKTVFVREYSKAMNEIDPVDPETRQYLLILYGYYGEEDETHWESIVGRTETYKWIKDNAQLFSPSDSIVLTPNVALKDALSVSEFVKHLHNADIVKDDFDIDVYEWDHQEEFDPESDTID